MMELENRALRKKLEMLKNENVTMQAAHESELRTLRKSAGSASSPPSSPSSSSAVSAWPKSKRPPGVFSDYSPFTGTVNDKEQTAMLKQNIRDLEERLHDTVGTLEEGKRYMIELLLQVDRKDRQIQELLAVSFRASSMRSSSSPTISGRSQPAPQDVLLPHLSLSVPSVLELPSATTLQHEVTNQCPSFQDPNTHGSGSNVSYELIDMQNADPSSRNCNASERISTQAPPSEKGLIPPASLCQEPSLYASVNSVPPLLSPSVPATSTPADDQFKDSTTNNAGDLYTARSNTTK
jgi:hypothetical protein